ncbi:DUF3515 domain-containing protein [Arthrobacter rhombi]|uniref:DUF3515 domain-containing protein n=1 Tax=Arthrobacter rhombi TaxID=71253 RepID=UPI003FD131E1
MRLPVDLFVQRRALPAVVVLLAGLSLAGCASPATVQPADDAANPLCADMMVAMPDELAGYELRPTTSQATAVWGDPAKIILRCGVNVPGPTTDQCAGVNGVDWVAKEGEVAWTLTTYGRTPATEVLFNPDEVPSSSVLSQLGSAAERIPAQGGCSTQDTSEDLP